MPKMSKHEKLATLIQKMLCYINEYLRKADGFIEFFIENRSKFIDPLFKTNHDLVIENLKNNTTKNYEKDRLIILSYCPEKGEITEAMDGCDIEDEANSLTYQIASIQEMYRFDEIFKKNSLSDPEPIYKESIHEWKTAYKSSDDIAANPQRLNDLPFAPKKNQNLVQAYDAVCASEKNNEAHHRRDLRRRYKRNLESKLLENLPRKDWVRVHYLHRFENKRTSTTSPSSARGYGRWKQCEVVDRYTAGRCLLWFIEGFLQEPHRTCLGEVACWLWIRMRAADEGLHSLTNRQILYLTAKQISLENREIEFGKDNLFLSAGLHRLLLCLRGEGKKSNKCRLFKKITNEKMLDRLFHEMSQGLGFSDPILPHTFCYSPHPYLGMRLPAGQRQAMLRIEPIVPYSSCKVRKQAKSFLENQI